jgi:succinylglutamate desuccinylase
LKLQILNDYPIELLDLDIKNIHNLFEGPTLIHLKGKSGLDPLFLSTLLHGNETTSFVVLQKLLKKYKDIDLPRDLIIFLGNTLAASEGMRHLPNQADYNRIWEEGDSPEHGIAREVVNYAKEHNLFASIDIHNNTGINPLYGCINSLDKSFVNLASHFGQHTVFFTEPHNVQSMAFSKFCTSITIEAGQPSEPIGIEEGFKFVDVILNLEKLIPNPLRDISEVFHTIGRIIVSKDSSIDFINTLSSTSDLSIVPTIDSKNFEIIKKGSHIGFAKDLSKIKVEDNKGRDITTDFFKIEEGKLLTNRVFIPSMFTKDVYVMKEDCLGYIMEIMIPTV